MPALTSSTVDDLFFFTLFRQAVEVTTSTLKKEATMSSKTMVTTYETIIQRHNSEAHPQSNLRRRENLKSQVHQFLYIQE
jgi:hypothetical protein